MREPSRRSDLSRATPPKLRMNRTEEAYAERLERLRLAGEILAWSFEPLKLRLGVSCYYTPDFVVVAKDRTLEMHEVKSVHRVAVKAKGFKIPGQYRERPGFRDDARVKIRVAAETHPYRFIGAYRRSDGSWEFEEF